MPVFVTVLMACLVYGGLAGAPVGRVCVMSRLFPSSLELTLSSVSATRLP